MRVNEQKLLWYGQCLMRGEAILFLLIKKGRSEVYSPRAFDYVSLPTEEVKAVYIAIVDGVYRLNKTLYDGLKPKLHVARDVEIRLYNPIEPRRYEYEDDIESPKYASRVWVEAFAELNLGSKMKNLIRETIGDSFGDANVLKIQGVYGDAHYFDPSLKNEYVKLMSKIQKIEDIDAEYAHDARKKIGQMFVR